MKLNKPLQNAIIVGLTGLVIMGLLLFLEYKSISVASDKQHFIVLSENSLLYTLFGASIVFIGIVFVILSFLTYKILNKNNLVNEALLISEKRFRTIFEEAPLGIALMDGSSGIIHDANPKYLEILGLKKEMLGKIKWMDLTHPDDLAESAKYKSGINERGLKNFKLLKRYNHTNGHVVWGNLSVSAIEGREKTHPLYLCMLEDITEQRKSEEKIKESEQKYRSLVDNASDIIMTLDLEDKITFINYTGGGYTPEQIIGSSAYNFVAPEYYEMVKQTHDYVKEYKQHKTYETVSHGLDGISRWFLTNVGPILADDKVTGLTLFTKDITSRKQTEEALRSSENELRKIFSVMEEIIFELDEDGKYLKIAPTNPSLLYKSAEVLLNKNIKEFFPADEASFFIAKIQESLNENKTINLEYNLTIFDRPIVFEASVSPLTKTTVLWIARDITERKHIEAERIKNQKNFEDAQRLAKIGSWEFNLSTFETQWSPEMYRIFEVKKNLSENLLDIYKTMCYPTDLEKIEKLTQEALSQGEGYQYEHRIVCANGKVKYLSCIGEVVKDENGKIIALKGTEQDITEVKKMQDLLKEKEQNASLIRYAAQLPGAMYQFRFFPDGSFYFPFVSDGATELCGLSVEEVKKDAIKAFGLIYEEDFETMIQSIKVSMSNLEYWTQDFRIKHPAKGIVWIRGNSRPEKLEDGSILWHGYFQNITDAKLAEEALKISRDKLEAAFNGSNDAIMLLTRKGFFDCNPKTLEMFGLTDRNEFVECHPSDLSPPVQPDGQSSVVKSQIMIEHAFEKGVNRFEWVHQRKNGDVFPAEVLLSAFTYGHEQVLQATVHDITERKMAENKIKENEALLSTILQTLPVGVFGKNIKRNFEFSLWNKKAEEIFGIKSEDCIGKTDYDFFPKQNADFYRQKDIEAIKTEGILDISEEVVESQNRRVIVHTKKTVVRDLNGDPHFLLGVSEDITEQREGEEKIRKSEEKYRSVVENAADIIIVTDSQSNIQFINRIREDVAMPSVIGKSIYDYISPEYHELVKQKLKKIYESKVSQNYEIQGVDRNGEKAWYSTNAGPIFSGKEVVGVTLITRDITERKTAEEKTRHSLKEKEILLKEVHHRVKNNLQIILSILNLQYANISDKKTLELLRDVRSRIKAMSFIHELLYQANDFSSINFSEYISNITTNLIYSYTQKEIDLKLDVGNVFLDLDRAIPCGLIINELLTNAFKYAFTEQTEGEISISLKKTDDQIKLIVADNGIGFPISIDYKNTESLGMQLVMTLIQQLRGEIQLDNTNGARYTIIFAHHSNQQH